MSARALLAVEDLRVSFATATGVVEAVLIHRAQA